MFSQNLTIKQLLITEQITKQINPVLVETTLVEA